MRFGLNRGAGQQEATLFGADTNTEGQAQIARDMQILLDWFGVRDLAEWHNMDMEQKRSYHEQFARGFEAYLYEGKAPSIELQGLFRRFSAWLVKVYRELRNLNVELSDEVRGVFDRMLASSEQIALAEQGRSMMPIFDSAQEAGMTPQEFAEYQALGIQATAEAIEKLRTRGLLPPIASYPHAGTKAVKKQENRHTSACWIGMGICGKDSARNPMPTAACTRVSIKAMRPSLIHHALATALPAPVPCSIRLALQAQDFGSGWVSLHVPVAQYHALQGLPLYRAGQIMVLRFVRMAVHE